MICWKIQFSLWVRLMGRSHKIVEAGSKVEVIFIGWACERSRCHQFGPAPVCAKGRHLLVGREDGGFFATRRWGWAGDEDGTVGRREGVW